MEADLVLRVELSTWLAQLALKDTLVGPANVMLKVSVFEIETHQSMFDST